MYKSLKEKPSITRPEILLGVLYNMVTFFRLHPADQEVLTNCFDQVFADLKSGYPDWHYLYLSKYRDQLVDQVVEFGEHLVSKRDLLGTEDIDDIDNEVMTIREWVLNLINNLIEVVGNAESIKGFENIPKQIVSQKFSSEVLNKIKAELPESCLEPIYAPNGEYAVLQGKTKRDNFWIVDKEGMLKQHISPLFIKSFGTPFISKDSKYIILGSKDLNKIQVYKDFELLRSFSLGIWHFHDESRFHSLIVDDLANPGTKQKATYGFFKDSRFGTAVLVRIDLEDLWEDEAAEQMLELQAEYKSAYEKNLRVIISNHNKMLSNLSIDRFPPVFISPDGEWVIIEENYGPTLYIFNKLGEEINSVKVSERHRQSYEGFAPQIFPDGTGFILKDRWSDNDSKFYIFDKLGNKQDDLILSGEDWEINKIDMKNNYILFKEIRGSWGVCVYLISEKRVLSEEESKISINENNIEID